MSQKGGKRTLIVSLPRSAFRPGAMRAIRGLVRHPGYLEEVATHLSERVDIDGNVVEKVAREDHLTADLILLHRALRGANKAEAYKVRIPIQSGQGFRFDVGRRSDLMSATIPK
jgi:hypothetical protein